MTRESINPGVKVFDLLYHVQTRLKLLQVWQILGSKSHVWPEQKGLLFILGGLSVSCSDQMFVGIRYCCRCLLQTEAETQGVLKVKTGQTPRPNLEPDLYFRADGSLEGLQSISLYKTSALAISFSNSEYYGGSFVFTRFIRWWCKFLTRSSNLLTHFPKIELQLILAPIKAGSFPEIREATQRSLWLIFSPRWMSLHWSVCHIIPHHLYADSPLRQQ